MADSSGFGGGAERQASRHLAVGAGSAIRPSYVPGVARRRVPDYSGPPFETTAARLEGLVRGPVIR